MRSKGFILTVTTLFFLLLFMVDLGVWMQNVKSRQEANLNLLKNLVAKKMLESAERNAEALLEAAFTNAMYNITRFVALRNDNLLEMPAGGSTEEVLESDYFNFTLMHMSKSCAKTLTNTGESNRVRKQLGEMINSQELLVEYLNQLREVYLASDFNITIVMKNCDARMADYKTAEGTFEYEISVENLEKSIKFSNQKTTKINVSIENFLDPVIMQAYVHATSNQNPSLRKIYFNSSITTIDDLKPEAITSIGSTDPRTDQNNIVVGKGWGYGEIIRATGSASTENYKGKIVYFENPDLFKVMDDEKRYEIMQFASAVVINNYHFKTAGTIDCNGESAVVINPVDNDVFSEALDIKAIAIKQDGTICSVDVDDFYQTNSSVFFNVDLSNYIGQKLIIYSPNSLFTRMQGNNYSKVMYAVLLKNDNFIYAVNNWIYINHSDSSSFVMRHYSDGYNKKSEDKGLLGFVYDPYAFGIMINSEAKLRDHRVDRYRDNNHDVYLIKGMHGCKNRMMCNNDISDNIYKYEHFALSTDFVDYSGIATRTITVNNQNVQVNLWCTYGGC